MNEKCKGCGCAMSECVCAKEMCPDCKCNMSKCCCAKRRHCLKFVALGLSIAIGPVLAGYFISQSLRAPATEDRFITVNVSVEKEARADYVIWRLGFQNTGNDIKILQEKFIRDRDAIISFLKQKGFKDDELMIGGPQITDQFAREWGQADVQKLPDNSRYILQSRIKVVTTNVDAVIAAVKEQDMLIKEGVIITQRDWDSNPRYYLKNQLKVEQDLYGDALQKANALAKQMAEGMSVKVKGLRSTEQQNPVSIMGQGQSGESHGWGGRERLKGPIKIAYLQMSAKYNIENK